MIRDTTGNEKRYLIKIRLMATFAKVWKLPPKISLLLLLLHNVPCVKRFLFNKSADVFILCRHIMTPDSDVIIRLHSIMTSESGVIICLHSIKTPEFRLHYT